MPLKLRSTCPATMTLLWMMTCYPCDAVLAADFRTEQTEVGISIHTDNDGVDIDFKGFRYTLRNAANEVIAPAHETSGLFFHGAEASETAIDRVGEHAVHGRSPGLRLINTAVD